MNALVSIMFVFLILPSIALAHYSEPLEEPSMSDETVKAIVNKYFNNSTLETPGDTSDRVFNSSAVVSLVALTHNGSMTLFIDRAFDVVRNGSIRFKGKLGRLPFAVVCRNKRHFNIYDFVDTAHAARERLVSIPGNGFRVFEGIKIKDYSALCKVHPILVSLLEASLSI